MSISFNPHSGAIKVQGELEGPTGVIRPQLIVDTGATRSLIAIPLLILAGYDPSQAVLFEQVLTASQRETLPVVFAKRFRALGQDLTNFSVLGHHFPANSSVDGLLGLDFLRGLTLTIDFRKGEIDLV